MSKAHKPWRLSRLQENAAQCTLSQISKWTGETSGFEPWKEDIRQLAYQLHLRDYFDGKIPFPVPIRNVLDPAPPSSPAEAQTPTQHQRAQSRDAPPAEQQPVASTRGMQTRSMQMLQAETKQQDPPGGGEEQEISVHEDDEESESDSWSADRRTIAEPEEVSEEQFYYMSNNLELMDTAIRNSIKDSATLKNYANKNQAYERHDPIRMFINITNEFLTTTAIGQTLRLVELMDLKQGTASVPTFIATIDKAKEELGCRNYNVDGFILAAVLMKGINNHKLKQDLNNKISKAFVNGSISWPNLCEFARRQDRDQKDLRASKHSQHLSNHQHHLPPPQSLRQQQLLLLQPLVPTANPQDTPRIDAPLNIAATANYLRTSGPIADHAIASLRNSSLNNNASLLRKRQQQVV
jgi:hypothetical protein